MEFRDWYQEIWGYFPFPWQDRFAEMLASGVPPDAIAAPTASGKTSVIDAWIWALAYFPDRVSRRLWYVVQRRVLVDDAVDRAYFIDSKLPPSCRERLKTLSAMGESLQIRRLRGGVFEDLGAFDVSSATLICSTADQHLSRLLFRGYGVSDHSLAVHAALAGTRATVVIDEAHIIPTYETNVRRCASLGADLRVIGMTATPNAQQSSVLRFNDEDKTHPTLQVRNAKCKKAELFQAKETKLAEIAKRMIKDGCRAVVVFCNTASVASAVASSIPNAWLLTGRVREYDRSRMRGLLCSLRSGSDGPAKPTVVVATQTLEVGADLDFDGLVSECASLSSLRQRFGRLDRLGKRENIKAAIVWDGKKQTPVYGASAGNTYRWLSEASDGSPDLSTDSINRMLEDTPPSELLEVPVQLGPKVTEDLLETWRQTSPRPLWDVPVADFIDPSDDTNVSLVWRRDALAEELIEAFPPHPQEAAPVPISAVRQWGSDRVGIRWRGPGSASLCPVQDLRPGDVWVLQSGDDDGRIALGCTLADSPADVADVPGERIRAHGELLDAIIDGASANEISEISHIKNPVVTPYGTSYAVKNQRRFGSLSAAGSAIGLGAHCQAVSDLASRMAESLGLDRQLLAAAALLHDIGKADERMQAWMGGNATNLLAKSGQSSHGLSQIRPASLPVGWRHELLSARMLPPDASPELVDLVATHHGRCRPSPPLHSDNGEASIDFAGLHFSSTEMSLEAIEGEAIERFAKLGNLWLVALRQSVLVMADRIASRDCLSTPLKPVSLAQINHSQSFPSFVASALDGSQLLGWMAAVGSLRVLSAERSTTLNWNAANRAVFTGWELGDAIEFLTERMKTPPHVFRPSTESEFESLGIWGPAVWRFDGTGYKQSPLLATGGGQTGLEKAWPKLADAITLEKLRQAIIGPWVYHKSLGQRWDTAEHAEHGSQWGDPSKEGSSSVHGASRLAIEALPLLPTLLGRITIGFDNETRAATWPLWRSPLSLDGVRVAVRQPMQERLRSRKIDVGQLASFLTSEPCERSGAKRNAVPARVQTMP